ncbi:MAG: efflux transporter outer membrane subunit [Burkholderiales bacterium]
MKTPAIPTLAMRWSVLLTAILLGACSSTVPYQAPSLQADHLTTLPSARAVEALASDTPLALWWTQLCDEQLDSLVRLAWKNNYDLRASVARLASSREQLQAAQGARLPGVTLGAESSHVRLAAIESRSGVPSIVDPVQWQATMAWELDLFGRVSHSIEAAQFSADERVALSDDVRRAILAQVVESYLELRGAQMLAANIQLQLDMQEETLTLIRTREREGSVAPVERMRYEGQLRLVGSRLPGLHAQERTARNRLATLTGQRLDAPMLALLDRPVPLQLPKVMLADEPARLLLRRPDVRAAERAMAVAAAREGIAQADLFPRVSLLSMLGGAGIAGDWLGSEAGRWRLGAGFSLPLFDGGARRAQLRAAGADMQVASANFEKVVAVALEETDSALSNWAQMRKRSEDLNTANSLTLESARLTRIRYREGAESLLGVLEADRASLATNEQVVLAKRDLAIATARCYVAMAGGLDVAEVAEQ